MSTAPALPATMRAVVMRAPGDVVVEDVEVPRVVHPTDVVLKIEAACVCGSDLWPYRGLQPVENRRMGHEYVGTVVEAGADVKNMKIGDFVIGSFMVSDNTCEICRAGYPSRCANAGSYTGMQAQYARVELADGTLVVVPGGKPEDPDRLADYLAASDVLGTGWFAASARRSPSSATARWACAPSWPPRPWGPRGSSPSPVMRTARRWPASSGPTSSSLSAAGPARPRSRS